MKHFQSKVLTVAILAALSGSAIAVDVYEKKEVDEKITAAKTELDKVSSKVTGIKEAVGNVAVAAYKNNQDINGFKAGETIYKIDENGNITKKEATEDDVKADDFEGKGLKEVVAEHDQSLANLTETVNENSEALVKTAEVVNEISTDVKANKAAIAKNEDAIAKKADQTALDTVSGKVDENKAAIAKKADQTALDTVSDKVTANETAIAKKADQTALDTVSGKVDENKAAIAKKADQTALDTVSDKADKAKQLAEETKQNVDTKIKAAEDAAGKAEAVAAKVTDIEEAAEVALVAAHKNTQDIHGFKAGDIIYKKDKNGKITEKEATAADVEADDFKGLGLKEVVAKHDESLGELTETVNENSEALVKTAEVVNAISADVNANKAALEEQKEANEGFNNAIASLDKDIGDLASAGKAAMEALEVNRQDIDANKAAIETKADKADFEELAKYTADMGKKVNDIGDAVTELGDSTKEAIAAVEKNIDANKQDIVGLTKGLGLAAEAVEDNRKEIDVNKAAIDANKEAIATKADKADVDELVKYTADMGKKVNNIGDEVTDLSNATSAAITRHDKDIVDLAQAGLKATEALEANRQDIDANKAAITENTAKLEEQKEANKGFNNAIASLDKDIGDLALAGKAAMEALEVNRQDIDANKAAIDKKADKTDIETAKKAAVEAEKLAKSVQGSVEVAQKSAETAESHAKAAQTSADAANKVASAAQTAVTQVQDAVKANTAKVATNEATIATLQTASSQHAAGIAKNSARIDSLDKNVANLRKETRQGLAAQAALSGLFQPYSVGKFNVTAALGGFKSDTAVAVGAGYRFNENFAAKAGLAVGTSSGGSASYNVGLNYEW